MLREVSIQTAKPETEVCGRHGGHERDSWGGVAGPAKAGRLKLSRYQFTICTRQLVLQLQYSCTYQMCEYAHTEALPPHK